MKIDHTQLLVSFFRIQCGFEEKVKQFLSKNSPPESRFYKCFGHHDIARFTPCDVVDYQDFNKSPNILQSINLYSIRWDDTTISKQIPGWFTDAPLVLLSLLKLHPDYIDKYGLDGELQAMRYIAERFPVFHPSLSTNLGHSEITLLLKGPDLSGMLGAISKIRREANEASIYKLSAKKDRELSSPIFANSTSFPLVSYESIIDKKNYKKITDKVNPIVMIRCQPGSDKSIGASLRQHGFSTILNLYGKEDILSFGNKEISLGDFTSRLLTFRRSWKNHPGLYSTSTYFNKPFKINDKRRKPQINEVSLTVPLPCQRIITTVMKAARDCPEPEIYNKIISFVNQFSCCAADPYISTEYSDMLEFGKYLVALLREIKSWQKKGKKIQSEIRKDILLDQLHVATEALYQRYSGIEAHLEGAPFPPFFAHSGINRIILAASDVPFFVLNNVKIPSNSSNRWSGFVVFSEGLPFQEFIGSNILSFPARALFSPIEEWPTVTHEISHIAYDNLGLGKLSNKTVKVLSAKLANSPEFPPNEIANFVYEMFAHWFDFCYFFQEQNIESFIEHLWTGWLKVYTVWRRKRQYLLRSLILYIEENYNEFIKTSSDKRKRKKYIRNCLDRMILHMRSVSSDFRDLVADLNEQDWFILCEDTRKIAEGLIETFQILKEKRIDKNLFSKLNAHYQNLDKHVGLLVEGNVITEDIENPSLLLLSVRKKASKDDIRTSLAIILSFANDYRKRRSLLQS
jgi:hypothetical protein